MDFNRMKDDCLIVVFRHFSHQELIRLRIVCRRWCAIVEIVAKSKTTMKLFDTFPSLEWYCELVVMYDFEQDPYLKLSASPIHDELIGVDLNDCTKGQLANKVIVSNEYVSKEKQNLKPNCTFLARLFPNIRHLIVSYSERNKYDLAYLLQEWSSNLYSLTLVEHFSSWTLLEQIIPVISMMNSLRRLEVFNAFQSGINNELGEPVFSSKIISQLEHLSLGSYPFELTPIFHQLGSNLTHLTLHACKEDQIIFISPDIIKNITHLTISPLNGYWPYFGINLEILQFVGNNFTFLKSFTFMANVRLNFFAIIESLRHMKLLTELRIFYNSNFLPSNSSDFPDLANNTCNQFNALKSVKTLQLRNSKFIFNPELFVAALRDVFPNVEDLTVGEQCTKKAFVKLQKHFSTKFLPQFNGSLKKSHLYWISIRRDLSNFFGTHKERFNQKENRCGLIKENKVKNLKRKK